MAFLTPALAKLRNQIDNKWPNRNKASDGWLGDPAHASRHSDHNPEGDGSVDAIDVTHDPANGVNCHVISRQIAHDFRLPGGGYIIFDGQIYNPDISDSWRPYSGDNMHRVHMHVSVADRNQNDTRDWNLGEEEFTMAEVQAMVNAQKETTTAVRRQGLLQRQNNSKNTLRILRAMNANTDDVVKELTDIETEIKKLPAGPDTV